MSKVMTNVTHDQLLDFFKSNFNVDVELIAADTLLFSSGLIDSFNMIELIAYIEESCEIRLKPSEIILDNIDSVGRILTFLDKRTG